VARFLPLVGQLLLLALVYHQFRLEDGAKFYTVFLLTTAAFAVHYFVPFAHKKTALFLLTVAGAFVLLGPDLPRTAGEIKNYGSHFLEAAPKSLRALSVLLAVGLVLFGCMRVPAPYGLKIVLVLAVGGGLAYCRFYSGDWIEASEKGSWERMWLAGRHWQLMGMLFMFRMILFCHEVRISKKPESLPDFLNYFFILPNFVVPIFPIIDYATMKKSYYVEDIHKTAQRGISWMARGTLQLGLYRILYHKTVLLPEAVNSFPTLIQWLIVPYLLYIQISGQFHIIAGSLHLFGYKLPETYRKYFLAENFTDFWRRINIYWKDFMIKVFYYPAYFRLRKVNETMALAVATIWVFTATTLLHAYQMFWLKNKPGIHPKDIIFWGSLGVLVMYNVMRQAKKGGAKPAPPSPGAAMVKRVLSTLGVFFTIAVLWSIWSSPSVSEWWDTVTYWD